jgi:hypothetical protein
MSKAKPEYPTTRTQLLESDYAGGDAFFTLARMQYEVKDNKRVLRYDHAGNLNVNISEDLIAVNDSAKTPDGKRLVDAVYEAGVELPTRKQINDGDPRYQDYVTLGAGGFVVLKDGKHQVMPLLQRSSTAQTNPGQWTNPSGLDSNKSVIDTMASEVAEELSMVKFGKKHLTLYAPYVISKGDDDEKIEERRKMAFKAKKGQIEALRAQLDPSYRDAEIDIEPLELMRERADQVPPLMIRKPGKEAKDLRVNYYYDEKKHALTVSAVVTGKMPEGDIRLFDLEGFGRRAELVIAHEGKLKVRGTSEEIEMEKLTPALRDAMEKDRVFEKNQFAKTIRRPGFGGVGSQQWR